MAASIALDELRSERRHLRVLDPMVGSGTTLVLARGQGHNAVGFDTDPMAVLIAKTWCQDVNQGAVRRAATRALERAILQARQLRLGDAYPCPPNDSETRAFLRYWFDGTNRRQLAALSKELRRVKDEAVQGVLWCAFSRMIITKQASVSLAMDLAHSRPHRVRDRSDIRPFDRFLGAVEAVIAAAPFRGQAGLGQVDVRVADARNLPLRSESIDLVITSPPYLNAIDYMRGHKFSLVWMGHRLSDLRDVRATSIGTEVSGVGRTGNASIGPVMREMGDIEVLPRRHIGMLAKYVSDMQLVIQEIARVLIPGGRSVLVVGDSMLRGVYVSNSRAVACLARQEGLAIIATRRRTIPDDRRYLPPPSASTVGKLQARMRKEVILTLRSPE